jgi:protein-disulfide isomerase
MQDHDLQDQWVDQRLAALEPPDSWQPDATRGLAQFRERHWRHPRPQFQGIGQCGRARHRGIFSDYECPHCATVFLQEMPAFVRDFVKTGKVKLIHRDFPLVQHQYARLATRYANAAGRLGYYDVVMHQIFQTQAKWELSGDIGTQVALVLPRDVMDKVRNLVQNDSHLDDSVGADVAIGRQDQLNQTPTMVVVYKGKRQLLAPVPPYELLKSYFDELLTK